MADMDDSVEKGGERGARPRRRPRQEIAAEAVEQARGATPIPKSSIEDWFGEAESAISRNPLLAVTVAGAVGFAIATRLMRRH